MSLSSEGRETVPGLILTGQLAQTLAFLQGGGTRDSQTPASHPQHWKRTHPSDGCGSYSRGSERISSERITPTLHMTKLRHREPRRGAKELLEQC